MTTFAGERIMVVEDIYFLAMEVETVLRSAGAKVVGPFPTSAAALDSLKQRAPDCAVLDVNLADGNSFDLARDLRMRGVPFLFFTGYDRAAIPTEFATVERLEKPVDFTRLLQKLEICCRRVIS